MDFDPDLLKRLLETFKEELNEKIQIMSDGLLVLEKSKRSDTAYVETLESIFRAAHNIKGAARGIGINNVGDIAHHIESLFSMIQKDSLAITPQLINIFFEAMDKMQLALLSFAQNTPLTYTPADFIARLEQAATPMSSTKEVVQPKAMRSKKKLTKKSKVNQGEKTNLSDNGENLTGKLSMDTKEFETIRVTLKSLDRISALMEELEINKIAIDDHYRDLNKLVGKVKQFVYMWENSIKDLKKILGNDFVNFQQKHYHSNADYVAEIDNNTSQLSKNLGTRLDGLKVLSHSLQEEIRMLRLIPATTLLRTLPRYVRDLAQTLNKKVELVIKGDEVKMDKIVLDNLRDPLIHLLRNAIDHGIEAQAVRQEVGKPELGRISIAISEEGGQIYIKISDDGQGINEKKIKENAINKKIMTSAELMTMNQSEILNLIFHPGFSTQNTISDISGRGVGLDVVKRNIENLKGEVKVITEVGKGTTFILQVPFTLTSERGLLIRCSNQSFVITTSAVERVIMMNISDIINVEGCQAIRVEDRSIYLRSLSDILSLEKTAVLSVTRIPIIILKKSELSVALMVDEIIGEREIVIKSLQAPLEAAYSVAGGTLAGNGEVIIVLDPNNLIERALRMTQKTHFALQIDVPKLKQKPHILVVDDSITTRTLEKSVLESKNYQVTTAVDGKQAWDLLQKQKFSLLITDVTMPNMDGFTLTEHVKKSEKISDLPVIIVTSLGSDAEKKRGIDVGADYYIVKSDFESGKLLEIVSQLV